MKKYSKNVNDYASKDRKKKEENEKLLAYWPLAARPPAVDGLALRALDVQHTFRDTDCAFSLF